jgi:hypothetical protein
MSQLQVTSSSEHYSCSTSGSLVCIFPGVEVHRYFLIESVFSLDDSIRAIVWWRGRIAVWPVGRICGLTRCVRVAGNVRDKDNRTCCVSLIF